MNFQMTAALEERIEVNLSALNYPRCVLHEEEGVTLRDEGERTTFQGIMLKLSPTSYLSKFVSVSHFNSFRRFFVTKSRLRK